MIATQLDQQRHSPNTANGSTVMPNGINEPSAPLRLTLRPLLTLNSDEFFALCQLNRELRMERTKEGEIVIMTPVAWDTGSRNASLSADLVMWARRDGTGVAADSSAGYDLPNGATRSPDASWVRRVRLATLSPEEKKKFLPLCPDFVIELRSSSDRLKVVQEKMKEYIENGAQLGWLIDPLERKVHVYRPNHTPIVLEEPVSISGDPELPGFVLDLTEIWQPRF